MRQSIWIVVLLITGAFAIQGADASTQDHAPISIEHDGHWTAENGVTGGTGTAADPYVIQGWTIRADDEFGIRIAHTNSHFRIEDVHIIGGSTGVLIQDARASITVRDVQVEDPYQSGIHIVGTPGASDGSGWSTDIVVESSHVTKAADPSTDVLSGAGIRIENAKAFVLQDNVVEDSDGYGLYLKNTREGAVHGNVIYGAPVGIRLQDHNDKNRFWNNLLDADTPVQGEQILGQIDDNIWSVEGGAVAGSNIAGGPMICGNYYADYGGQDGDGDGLGDARYETTHDGCPLIDLRQASTSAYVDRAPIYIRSIAEFTPANGVTGGSGTATDPFVISGWKIVGSGRSMYVAINDADAGVHYVIRDNMLVSDTGPSLQVSLGNEGSITIEGNQVSASEMALSASLGSGPGALLVRGNTFESQAVGSYGSSMWGRGELTDNMFVGDAGLFVAATGDIQAQGNQFEGKGTAGTLEVRHQAQGSTVQILDNVLRFASIEQLGTGDLIFSRPSVASGTNILGQEGLCGNHWADYAGDDADGDGFGDTPHPSGDACPLVKLAPAQPDPPKPDPQDPKPQDPEPQDPKPDPQDPDQDPEVVVDPPDDPPDINDDVGEDEEPSVWQERLERLEKEVPGPSVAVLLLVIAALAITRRNR